MIIWDIFQKKIDLKIIYTQNTYVFMEIVTHKFSLNIYETGEKFKSVTMASYNQNYIIYNIIFENSQSRLHKVYLNGQLDRFLIFEYVNKSPLWEMRVEYICNYAHKFCIKYFLDVELMQDFFDKSLALAAYIYSQVELLPQFNKFNSETSFISYNEPLEQPKLCKLKLYDYQLKSLNKMIQIETNQTNDLVNYLSKININSNVYNFDPIMNVIVSQPKYFSIKTKGGILADEMGLGKTITSLGLVLANPSTNMDYFKYSQEDQYNKIVSKATVVVCPSHLTKQWESESAKVNPHFKILTILTKKDHEKLKFKDFIDVDIIITSHQFLMNFKYYPTLYYGNITASSYSPTMRTSKLKAHFTEKISKLTYEETKKLDCPIFEFFSFHRLILDEGHEIFGEMLGNHALSVYMTSWLSSIDSNYKWYISGSPFVNYSGLTNSLKFIGLKLTETETNLVIDLNKMQQEINISKEYLWNSVLEKICIRHKKSDIVGQIEIMGYDEHVEWIQFTDLERNIYESKKGKTDNESLLKLCCHPLVLESAKRLFGDVELDLDMMQVKLVEHHSNTVAVYKEKLAKLTNTNQSYHMVKKNYENIISESSYLLKILEKINDTSLDESEEKCCSICLEPNDLSLTKCGHMFCIACIKEWVNMKHNCPVCKKDLYLNEVYSLNKKQEIKEEINPLIKKYGSKLGKIISMIRSIITNPDSRVIIFSQWDTMLSLISKTLSENGIANCSVKGNVWSRTAAISKFKNGKTLNGEENKVILLSLKNCASGTNLTEASHIFFVDPINEPKGVVKAIEGQAIARACRIGQKQKITLYRTLIKDSIDEIIYNKNYV